MKKLKVASIEMDNNFRRIMEKPEFAEMNQLVEHRYKAKRHRIHIYSFKKFAFTRIADTLGEIAARAIKGDGNYVQTYYKKSRDERAEDYRKLMPELSVFSSDEAKKVKEELEESINRMSEKDLGELLEFIKNGKNLPRK